MDSSVAAVSVKDEEALAIEGGVDNLLKNLNVAQGELAG